MLLWTPASPERHEHSANNRESTCHAQMDNIDERGLYKQGVEEFASRRMYFKTRNTRALLWAVFVYQKRVPIARCG
jgi:hypothetical protein